MKAQVVPKFTYHDETLVFLPTKMGPFILLPLDWFFIWTSYNFVIQTRLLNSNVQAFPSLPPLILFAFPTTSPTKRSFELNAVEYCNKRVNSFV